MVTNNVIGIDIKRRLQDISDIKVESGESVKRSIEAKVNADESSHRSDVTKKQLDEALKNGDQVVEVQTLRVDPVTREVYNTAPDRFEANQRNVAMQFADIAINVKVFGAKGDRITDDTIAIQEAYDSLLPGQTLQATGEFLITNLIFDKPNVRVVVDGNFIQKSGAVGSAVKFGNHLYYLKNLYAKISVLKEGISSKSDWLLNDVGIEVLNIQNSNFYIDVEGFKDGLLLIASNSFGTAYNNYFLTKVVNNKNNINTYVETAGWVNENKFYGGRLAWDNRFRPVDDKFHIKITGEFMNQNIFFSPSLEGDNGTFVYINGFHNSVYSPRFESTQRNSIHIHLTEKSQYNAIIFGYGAQLTGYNYINIGIRNSIFSSDLIDTDSIIKANTGVFKGNPFRYGTAGGGVVDATNINSQNDPVYVGRDATENITSKVLGNGSAEYRKVTIKPSTPENQILHDIQDIEGESVFSVLSQGSAYGTVRMNRDYMENHFIPHSVREIAGPPTGDPGHIGVAVLNSHEGKMYYHLGKGVWKGSLLV